MTSYAKRLMIPLTVAPLALLANTMALPQQPATYEPPARVTTSQAGTFAEHLEAARASAGTEWLGVVDHMCTRGSVVTGSADDPLIEPVRIFDNVYAIGRTSTVVYVIATNEGLMLIDSGYADQVDSVLLPGMAQLGLEPQDIRYVVVLHGHADHYGGSAHLQQRFGARVVASEADWALMEVTDPDSGRPTPPVRDVVAIEGEPLRLGDGMVTPFLVPGHTPGAISVVFPVRDAEDTHTAAVFGGTALVVPLLGDAMPQYLESIDRFAEIATEMGVNVLLQNHPLFDGMHEKLERLKVRGPGDPHPFVLDALDSYGRFMTTLAYCSRAQVAAASGSDG
ncbi:MAG: MBL fold metallo-hydrolase [Rhodospirillaceae bacterium]|nr:MBL fold metallo-hydrolase [Rhodospirillaceae bacterium]